MRIFQIIIIVVKFVAAEYMLIIIVLVWRPRTVRCELYGSSIICRRGVRKRSSDCNIYYLARSRLVCMSYWRLVTDKKPTWFIRYEIIPDNFLGLRRDPSVHFDWPSVKWGVEEGWGPILHPHWADPDYSLDTLGLGPVLCSVQLFA